MFWKEEEEEEKQRLKRRIALKEHTVQDDRDTGCGCSEAD